MKKLFVIVCLMLISPVYAGEKISKQLDVNPDGLVEIHNERGKITINGWDKNQVSIKGTLDNLTEKFVFNRQEDKTIIKVILPDSNTHSDKGGSKLEIFVPQNVALLFNGISTDLKINNINNGIEINSVSGDVDVAKVKKRSYINNVSGDIKLKSVSGRIEISTVSGDVKAEVSARNITISGVSSDLYVKGKDVESAVLSTVSGDTKLYATLVANGEIKMSNVSGDSYFYAGEKLNARISLDTGPGGDIVNNFSADKPSHSFVGSEKLKITLGDGNGSVRMSTVTGTLGLKKR